MEKIKPWKRFKGMSVSKNSILLTRLEQPSFLDTWQGLILFVKNNEEKDRVSEFAKKCIEQKNLNERKTS